MKKLLDFEIVEIPEINKSYLMEGSEARDPEARAAFVAKMVERAREHARLFPSSIVPHTKPMAWLQWEASNVFIDIVCECGHAVTMHDYFLYHVRCPECGATWELDGHITLHRIEGEVPGVRDMEDCCG